MLGRCESHIVAVATAIVFYTALNKCGALDPASTADITRQKPAGASAPPVHDTVTIGNFHTADT